MSTSEDRRLWLGGSDIASIFGVSPWKTALDLYEEKTAETWSPPEVEPKRERLYRRGKRLEPWVMEMLEEERPGIFIVKKNQRYTDEQYPWMSCEIDFEYQSDAGVCNGDVKTVSPFAAGEWGEEGTDEIPLSYCLQFHWGMMITGRPSCLVAVLIGADDLRIYEVKRDDELIAEMRRQAVQFWTENVLKKVPPAPQNVEDCNKLLFRFGGFACIADEQVEEDIRSLREVRKREKEIKVEKDALEMKIKRFLTIQAEVAGKQDGDLKKFQIVGVDNKPMATLSLQHRAGYTVAETDFFVLRCGKE